MSLYNCGDFLLHNFIIIINFTSSILKTLIHDPLVEWSNSGKGFPSSSRTTTEPRNEMVYFYCCQFITFMIIVFDNIGCENS